MDRPTKAALAAQVREVLVGRMQEIARFTYIMTGGLPDPRDLVSAIQRDTELQVSRIGTYPSTYSTEEIAERVEIVRGVVLRLAKEAVGAHWWGNEGR